MYLYKNKFTNKLLIRPELKTPLSESFQCRQLFCKLSKIRQEVKHKLSFETWQ